MARSTAREEVRTTCHAHKRQLIARLNEGLTLAASASQALAEVEDAERSFTGSWFLSGMSWPELAAPSSAQGSRLDDWRAAARTAGLLLD